MPTYIRFRLNKITGNVEEFLVDDRDRTLSEEEHDRVACEVGQVIARHPRIIEDISGSPIFLSTPVASTPESRTVQEEDASSERDNPTRES